MKFTKSIDGKRRADMVLKVRIGYMDLLTGLCAMMAHNQLMELMELYSVKAIAHVPRSIEGKKKITRMGVVEFIRESFRTTRDIEELADDFESDASAIALVLSKFTDPTTDAIPDTDCVTNGIIAEARKRMKVLYPELKKSDQ